MPATMQAIGELVRWAKATGLVMLRVEPQGPVELAVELSAAGFRRGPLMEARRTAIVTLRDDESMLASFRKSTRHNLRQAQRSGVVVDEVADSGELSRQVLMAAERHRVYITGAAFHRAVVDSLPHTHVYVARYGDEALAAALVTHHDRRAYYLIAGSSARHRETMPSYAFLWRAMQEARSSGCVDFDLCGLPLSDLADDPMSNLRQFKTGFGGEVAEYPGAWDIVLRRTRYWVMRRAHRIRLRSSRLLGKAQTLAARPR